ncbi:hypothetical protein NC652_005426 [Populus alba x Populus x berolinensis]|nr:hypothetical protein NC652_005426 [Populus alba x Populus x berolinensis]
MLDFNTMFWNPSKLKAFSYKAIPNFIHNHPRVISNRNLCQCLMTLVSLLYSTFDKYIDRLSLSRRVFVGDVVLLKDPEKSDDFLVRRLAAIEGYEMVSADEKDDPFVLDKDECWVLADNDKLKPKEANDSRTFGPISMSNIVGRVIYCLQTAVDHGPVQNSHFSMRKDSPVLEVELDVEEMAKNHKA